MFELELVLLCLVGKQTQRSAHDVARILVMTFGYILPDEIGLLLRDFDALRRHTGILPRSTYAATQFVGRSGLNNSIRRHRRGSAFFCRAELVPVAVHGTVVDF
jgi:hypothetical protein